jgi:hypothetical protein
MYDALCTAHYLKPGAPARNWVVMHKQTWRSSAQLGSYAQANLALQRAGHPKTWRSTAQVEVNIALQRAGHPKTWRSTAQVEVNIALQRAGHPASHCI